MRPSSRRRSRRSWCPCRFPLSARCLYLRCPFACLVVCVAEVACARAQPDKFPLDGEVLVVTDVTATQGVDCFSYHYQGTVAGVACLIYSFLGFGFGLSLYTSDAADEED